MIKMYDLAGADENRRFSPYCWRIRMALAHKGLEVEYLPWHFVEKDKIKFSGQGKVPVLIDGSNTIADSWEISKYLESTYPERPSLKMDNGEVMFIKFWTETVLHPEILKLLVLDIHDNLSPEDQPYFRETREKRFGLTLEQVVVNRQERLPRIQKILTPLRSTLSKQKYLSGETPGFSDYIVFGAFQWARCMSGFLILNADDIIYKWRDKMLNMHEGLALSAVGYPI
ncbi:MAG: glutathione S-transferase [Deltaproteobacteria bacterium]|nr:glutathione S-transferase [Deltaproteobacteria bacterium]|tara:strand:- start:632 stop:1315 length:684 start_codon:yes stop_codon:yes gene_type:complete